MSHDRQQRDPTLREAYLKCVLSEIPRLLGAVDRCPMRKTYGCFDREYWHYRTSGFPSEMYQEAVLPLALVATTRLPGSVWHGEPLLRELVVAGIRFSARNSHADGSCDDYYPYERALGAAVFSLQAAARAYQLLELNDPELVDWFIKRAEWVERNDESGRLTNHHALAAIGLARVAQITGEARFEQAAEARISRVLDWQHDEGWFDEYGGADPGYQTVTIDCLTQYRKIVHQKNTGQKGTDHKGTGDSTLDEPLRRAVRFARYFLHPDDSFGGEYGSRGTRHFYPHGMELLAAEDQAAAELADGFLRSLTRGTVARFGDDRMYVHRLASMIEAWRDWSPECPTAEPEDLPAVETRFFPSAGILVDRTKEDLAIISAARGGVFKFFGIDGTGVDVNVSHQADSRLACEMNHDTSHTTRLTDAGLVIETTDRQISVSQQHGHDRTVCFEEREATTEDGPTGSPTGSPTGNWTLKVEGPLHRVQFETATPLNQILLFGFMTFVGRWCRTLVRRLLQRRLITGRHLSEIRLERTFERREGHLTITDRISLTEPRLTVRRISYAVDFEAKYTAASGVFQRDALQGWHDLDKYIEELNDARSVEITRELVL